MEAQLEEVRKNSGGLIGFETTGVDGGVVLHVKRYFLQDRSKNI